MYLKRTIVVLPVLLLLALMLAAGAWLRRTRPAAAPAATALADVSTNVAQPPATNQTAAPEPVVAAVLNPKLDRASGLVNQGERARYDRNDYIAATDYFQQALAINPADLRAANYLRYVQDRALPGMLEECENLVGHQNLQASKYPTMATV